MHWFNLCFPALLQLIFPHSYLTFIFVTPNLSSPSSVNPSMDSEETRTALCLREFSTFPYQDILPISNSVSSIGVLTDYKWRLNSQCHWAESCLFLSHWKQMSQSWPSLSQERKWARVRFACCSWSRFIKLGFRNVREFRVSFHPSRAQARESRSPSCWWRASHRFKMTADGLLCSKIRQIPRQNWRNKMTRQNKQK